MGFSAVTPTKLVCVTMCNRKGAPRGTIVQGVKYSYNVLKYIITILNNFMRDYMELLLYILQIIILGLVSFLILKYITYKR